MNFKVMAVAAVLGGMFVIDAQEATTSTRQDRADETVAENSLVGVNLFDTGLSLLDKFGSPVNIAALTIGSGGVGPGGGFGGGGGAGGGGVGGRPSPGAAGSGARVNRPGTGVLGNPFSATDPLNVFGQAGPNMADEGARPGQGSDTNRVGGGGGGTVGGGGSEAGERVLYTRWIYHQPTSRYGFVIDKNQRVIQIEAVGLLDSNVKTDRGITFGSTFEDVVRAYNVPDAYEISGTTLVMRYLVRDHVAFRLSKLDANKPHQVTGIVVAAGKQ
ncbi:MAG: hypothetical protein IH944_04710 [Armatimonadetes bacterium]|nr:hypothetical protein [Armatimonadota bacterium]